MESRRKEETMLITSDMVKYGVVKQPMSVAKAVPVDLTEETVQEHLEKMLERINVEGLDAVLIYGDREHGANYGYLTGFEPRFEESLLLLHKDGKAHLFLGNEAMKMEKFCRIPITAVHTPQLSLPNQPMKNDKPLENLLKAAGVEGQNLGLVGWKLFTASSLDQKRTYDLPHFIVEAAKRAVGQNGEVQNATRLFIHPEKGARVIANANEIAHYEFGAAIASNRILKLINAIELGKTELELAENLSAYGQHLSVHSICATGERFTNAVVAPRNKAVKLGDRFSTTMALRGGLTYRSGYVVKNPTKLPADCVDYLERVAKPYFAALTTWYSTIRIGLEAGQLYNIITQVAPQEKYGWELNPGHLTSSDEWVSSPVYPGSKIKFRSGMMLQADIIFDVAGYGGSSAEDGIVLADEGLRNELESEYPQVWKRMLQRRAYMENVLGIRLHKEVLPMSDICGYLRPFLLAKDKAFYLEA
jgi:Xaa-Pro aminopeptidase